MKIVVVGDGKVGYTLTERLSKEGHDIVVIDSKKDVLREAVETLDVQVVHGNGASLKVQRQADVSGSDLLIAATSADEINILCCIIAKKLGCGHTIARIRNPEYAEQMVFLKDDLGLSLTINPEQTTATEIFRLLQYPSFLKRDVFAKGKVEIVEIELDADSPLNGKQLSELYRLVRVRVLVCAVEREDQAYIPDGGFRLQQGDKLYVTAPTGDLTALIRHLKMSVHKVKDVLIIGGGRIAHYLARQLLGAGVSVKIIEINKEICVQLAEQLPGANIVCADGTNQSVLLSEGIENTDAVVTLTNMDEENLIVSMYANYLNIPKVVTKINRTEYSDVFREKGIACMVSPKMQTANDIIRYVRALTNTGGGSMLTLHRIVGDKVEALEFRVTQSTANIGKTLAEIQLKPNILIACINRRGRMIIPKGSDTMEAEDTVIVVATANRTIYGLNDIFAVQPAAIPHLFGG